MTKPLTQEQKMARRPTSKACTFCHAKHLQCDQSRPCKNCVKRNIAVCEDAPRRRAKYMAKASTGGPKKPKIEKELGVSSFPSSLFAMNKQSSLVNLLSLASTAESVGYDTPLYPLGNHEPVLDMPTVDSRSDSVFDSHFANDEYEKLKDIIDSHTMDEVQPSAQYNQKSIQLPAQCSPIENLDPNIVSNDSNYTSPLLIRHLIRKPHDVYNVPVTPHDYPQAYHELLSYLKSRFPQEQVREIARNMAHYRPSFISAIKNLIEPDLVFAELSFQRSLLEYESLCALGSATPTVMWRRTCEIVAVTQEFSAMTGWSKQDLLKDRKFIIELFDNHSVLDYFETFSSIAFGEFRNDFIWCEVVIHAKNGEPMRCASTWTVKRDSFDIPMLIVGQFLPVF